MLERGCTLVGPGPRQGALDAATDREMDSMRQWLVALIAAGLLLLFAVPTAAAADCALDSGFATLKALIEAAEGPDKVGACLENAARQS